MKLVIKKKEAWIEQGKCYAPWYDEGETYLEEGTQVPLLRFRAAEAQGWLRLAFSTRLGGVSGGHLSTLNLGWDRGDAREHVCENYRRVCRELGADYRKLVLSDQVHGTNVCYAGTEHTGGEAVEKRLSGIDGLITALPGLILATSYADCVPLFFFDPVRHIIASSHSGWKGTVSYMGQRTVEKLQEMGCSARNLIAVIGPSICQECYEVDRNVAEQFYRAYPEEEWGQILTKKKTEGKYLLDLWAANWLQLKRAGMAPENIHISGVCTCCNCNLLFSHRATNGRRGNLNGFMMITAPG